jgi:hypothetical protein
MTGRSARTDRFLRRTVLTATAAILTLGGGCTADEEPASEATLPLPRSDQPYPLDPEDLGPDIDNEFWPMEPGTRWVYEEKDEDGVVLRVVVTVTSSTRRIANGVVARVVRDTVTAQDGSVVEDTFDWYAQDGKGNVWYLGEDTAELEEGEIVSREGSFEAGVDGALAGVIMPAEPTVGQRYRQEYYAGEAEDNGEVLALGQMADVPAGHFENALLTADTVALEPDVLEYKLYAPGLGPVLTLGISGGIGREALVEHGRVSTEIARLAGETPLGRPYP